MRIALSLLLFLPATLVGQQEPAPYERMLESRREVIEHLKTEARLITDDAAEEMRSRASWEALRPERKLEMLDMLGLDPLPAKTHLNVQVTGVVERPGYRIEKIAFESLPKVYATASLYLPTGADGPVPTVIYVCGHAYSAFGAKTAYQRHGHTLAKHGYAAMIIDPIQIAETFGLHHGILNNEMYDWYSRGYTPAGLEVWNVIRALDYLETRPEIDAERFGITGRSGGAAMSWFAASVDERLKVAVPVMGISTYAANVTDNTQKRHCDCMFVINSRLHDMLHQGALIVPRPLLMAHGKKDLLFPVPGYEEFERVVRRLYDGYGKEQSFRNVVVDTGHTDSDYLRAEALKWFDKHLKKIPAREIDVSFEEVPAKELAVFGGEPPADSQNFRVHEFFNRQPQPESYPTLSAWKQRRVQLIETLKQHVFGAFPEKSAAVEAMSGALSAPDGFEALQFESEPGVSVQALYRASTDGGGAALLYVASDGDDWGAIRDVLRQIAGSKTNPLMVVFPRGVGEVPWPKKSWKDIQRNAMHVGRTVDSMRLWDVLRSAQLLRAKAAGGDLVVAGASVSGALGLYAAVLDEEIDQAILIDAPRTHRDGPIFLNVLRYTDLPEAAAMAAPRRVTFYGRMPEEYEFARGVFALYDAPEKMALTMSIEGALNGRFEHRFPSGL